jgi:Class III cytochrome C family
MRVRLTDIKRTKKKREKKPQAPRFVETDALTIGRGTDADVHLAGLDVKFEHAAVLARQGKIFIEKREADTLVVERRDDAGRVLSHDLTAVKEATPGDVLRIGRYEITVVEPQDDETLALEIEEVAKPTSERDEVEKRYDRGIERGILRRRPLSWALALVVLGLFLAVPLLLSLAGPHTPGAGTGPTAGDGVPAQPVAASEEPGRGGFAHVLTQSWSVGTIALKHQTVACESCHVRAWQRVDDDACLASGCHADVGAHVDDVGIDAWRAVEDLTRVSCIGCHAEHRGEHALIRTSERECTTCHAGIIQQRVDHPDFGEVMSFGYVDGKSGHPQFRASLIELEETPPGAPPVIGRRRVEIGSAELVDRDGGLIFPHDVHLEANLRGFAADEHTQLECSSCHELAPGGEIMTKVTYAKNCQSCHWHSLRFTEAAAIEAPHPKQPDEVRHAILEFFLAEERRGASADVFARGPFRRPGARAARAASIADASPEALAAAEADALIEDQCKSCHVFDGEGESLRVRPVITIPFLSIPYDVDRWLPYAEFSHATHAHLDYPPPSMERLECESCHLARDREKGGHAEIVLLPGIEECQRCHVGETPEPSMIASSCLTCHEFHERRFGPMSGDERTAGAQRMRPVAGDRAS